MALITKVKEYREKKGLKQSELAALVEARRETIVHLENGKYNPSLKLAMEIADVFDTTVEELFEFTELTARKNKEAHRMNHLIFQDFLLKKQRSEGSSVLYTMKALDSESAYTVTRKKESLLTKSFVIQSGTGEETASVLFKHVVFEKVSLPTLKVTCKTGKKFIVKRDMELLSYLIKIEDEQLKLKGNPYSGSFELFHQEDCIAKVSSDDKDTFVSINETAETLATAAVLTIMLAMEEA